MDGRLSLHLHPGVLRVCKKRVFYCRFLSKDACMLFQSTSAQMTQPQHEQESRQAYPYTNSYIKKCNPFPPPSTIDLDIEKTPLIKPPSLPYSIFNISQLPSHSPSQSPDTNRSKETKPGPALPSPARPRKTEKKKSERYAKTPSFLSHTCTDKMPKRQTRKKQAKKESLWPFLPPHSLREKNQNGVYIHDRLGNTW